MVCIIAACLPLKHEKKVTIKSLGGREFVLKPDAGIEIVPVGAIVVTVELRISTPVPWAKNSDFSQSGK